jgi:carotenoid cleavage dioxygenase-like enzyme
MRIDRRRFLSCTGISLAAACGPRLGGIDEVPVGVDGPPLPSDPPAVPSPVPVQLADTGPALQARVPASLATAERIERSLRLQVLSGALPAGLTGHVFINSALPQSDGSPLFNGDGLFHRLDLGDGPVLTTRIARTPCYYADVATRDHPDGFKNRNLTRMSRALGSRTFANTGFIPFRDRVLATYDGGRPYEIDTNTLDVVTGVGRFDEWMPGLPAALGRLGIGGGPFPTILSTAHPAVDDDAGEIFFVNYTFGMPLAPGRTLLLRWNGVDDLVPFVITDELGSDVAISQSVHQMAVTRRFVVLMDTAFVTELSKMTGIGPDVTPQAAETVLWIVRRSDLHEGNDAVVARRVVIPLDAAHFHADVDDDNGIVLHVAHSCTSDPSEFLESGDHTVTGDVVRPDLHGVLTAPSDLGALGRYVVDGETGRVTSSQILRDDAYTWGGPALVTFAPGTTRFADMFWVSLGLSSELAVDRVLDAYRDWEGRHVPVDEIPFAQGRPGTLFRVRTDPLAIVDGYTFPSGRVGLSPTFIPQNGGNGIDDGWIICPVLSDDDATPGSSGDELWIFDARNLAQGPLCRLGDVDLDLPFTLHTAWLPTVGPRTATYQVSVRDELADAVSALSPELQQLFEDEVYPPFEQ